MCFNNDKAKLNKLYQQIWLYAPAEIRSTKRLHHFVVADVFRFKTPATQLCT
jgi:hypothetical protein